MNKTSLNKSLTLCLLNLLILTQTGIVRAQQSGTGQSDQDEVIKVETALVQLRAVVTNRKGEIVDNLRQEDFEVFEDGKPQAINFFSLDHIPGQHAPPARTGAAAETGPVASQAQPGNPPARTVVLFVDTLHLSPINLLRAKKQLLRFVDEQLTDNDLAAVVVPTGTLGILQQFMRNRARLKYAISKISIFQPTPSLFTPYLAAQVLDGDNNAIQVAIKILAGEEGYIRFDENAAEQYVTARAQIILAAEANFRRASFQMLKALSERLADMKGQRMIAYISEGFTLRDSGGGAESQDLSAATSRAVRAGVLIYTFNAKGLSTPVETQAETPVSGFDFSDYMSRSETDQKDVLRVIADETGARAFINRNDLKNMLGDMLEENRTYYALAYYPAENKDNKKLRKIKVQVKNHPDYTIRVQRGYKLIEEPKTKVAATPQQALLQAMLAPLPATNIGVTSTANFLARADDAAQAVLQVHIDGNSLQYPAQGQNYLLDCELAVLVLNRQGQVATSFSETVKGALSAEQLAAARRNGFRFERRLNLKPGLYQVRVGVREQAGGAIGTSDSWLEVPDLSNKRLALSGIFLGQTRQEDAPVKDNAASAPPPQQPTQPTLLIGLKPFKSGDEVFYRFVVYNTTPQEALLKVEITQGDAPVYSGNWQPLSGRVIRNDSRGVEAGGQIRVTLPPGLYTLHVSVKDTHAKKPAEQTIDFEVGSQH